MRKYPWHKRTVGGVYGAIVAEACGAVFWALMTARRQRNDKFAWIATHLHLCHHNDYDEDILEFYFTNHLSIYQLIYCTGPNHFLGLGSMCSVTGKLV